MAELDEFDRRLLNRVQHGLPLVRHPWQALSVELEASEERIRQRLQELLDDGTLTRFGPMFDIEQLGGAFTLAAMRVPEERFEEVTEQLNNIPAVAHNYQREHDYNMWFVLATATPEGITETIEQIEQLTGLTVLNLPKEKTYHVGLHFPL
ncbi:MAG: Lrp/AsnC family transcriptional regulator [Thiopseudomonas sp.]|nr:Lrp/AsnC family transcriptional regulator [Thiopseudomonas sp.]MCK9464501.1 Lrp/AsnC family transcriptional regulator [Thiopseudomonas sp.]